MHIINYICMAIESCSGIGKGSVTPPVFTGGLPPGMTMSMMVYI